MDKVNFVKLKNKLYSTNAHLDIQKYSTLLGFFAQDFWEAAGEKNPMYGLGVKIPDKIRGQVVLERIYFELSPRRYIELLQYAYDLIKKTDEASLYTKKYGTHAMGMAKHFLSEIEQVFNDLGILELLEVSEIEPEITEQIYDESLGGIPDYVATYCAAIEMKYLGKDFAREESNKIIIDGFKSKILDDYRRQKKNKKNKFIIKINNLFKNINFSIFNINK